MIDRSTFLKLIAAIGMSPKALQGALEASEPSPPTEAPARPTAPPAAPIQGSWASVKVDGEDHPLQLLSVSLKPAQQKWVDVTPFGDSGAWTTVPGLQDPGRLQLAVYLERTEEALAQRLAQLDGEALAWTVGMEGTGFVFDGAVTALDVQRGMGLGEPTRLHLTVAILGRMTELML